MKRTLQFCSAGNNMISVPCALLTVLVFSRSQLLPPTTTIAYSRKHLEVLNYLSRRTWVLQRDASHGLARFDIVT